MFYFILGHTMQSKSLKTRTLGKTTHFWLRRPMRRNAKLQKCSATRPNNQIMPVCSLNCDSIIAFVFLIYSFAINVIALEGTHYGYRIALKKISCYCKTQKLMI